MSNLKHKSLILVGSMGVGKTTIGRALARRLNWDFKDTDEILTERCGVDIATIFEVEGEAGFREREAAVLKEFIHEESQVLATGGGVVVKPENREVLRQSGIVIYLFVEPDTLYERVRHDKIRPLLQVDNPMERMHEIFAERDPLYRMVADLVVYSGQQSISQLVGSLIRKLRDSFELPYDQA